MVQSRVLPEIFIDIVVAAVTCSLWREWWEVPLENQLKRLVIYSRVAYIDWGLGLLDLMKVNALLLDFRCRQFLEEIIFNILEHKILYESLENVLRTNIYASIVEISVHCTKESLPLLQFDSVFTKLDFKGFRKVVNLEKLIIIICCEAVVIRSEVRLWVARLHEHGEDVKLVLFSSLEVLPKRFLETDVRDDISSN